MSHLGALHLPRMGMACCMDNDTAQDSGWKQLKQPIDTRTYDLIRSVPVIRVALVRTLRQGVRCSQMQHVAYWCAVALEAR